MSGQLVARPQLVLGDAGARDAWPAQLWPALADPARRTRHPVPGDHDAVDRHVEHWAPLLALTLGALGWGRPDLGVSRWMADGRPGDGGALDLLERWWGPRAAGLVAWSRASVALAELSALVSEELHLPMPEARVPVAASDEAFPALTSGGTDPLRLARVVEHLVAPTDADGTLFRGPAEGSAVLLLEHDRGWYRLLHERGAELPALPDRRSWSVDVVVRTLGSLGVYRRSRLTGRWSTASEAVHLLGWPSPR